MLMLMKRPRATATVTRNTDGSETKITLAHFPVFGNDVDDYESEAVEAGYEIDDWSGQTLKRVNDEGDLQKPQEATVYTNIEPATPQKLKRGGEDEKALGCDPGAIHVYVLGDGEDVADINTDDSSSFEATYNGHPGTFTCPAGVDNCSDIEVT